MLQNRYEETVETIELKRSEWCYYISKKGVRYVISNANHKLIVMKPMNPKIIKPTREIRNAIQAITVL